jgi:hypothetical protein
LPHVITAVVLHDERLFAYSPRLALGLALLRHDRNLADEAARKWHAEGWTGAAFRRALSDRSLLVGDTATTTRPTRDHGAVSVQVRLSAIPLGVELDSRYDALNTSSSLPAEALWTLYRRGNATGRLVVTIAAARNVAHARWSPKRPTLDARALRERERAEAEAERRAEAAYLEEAPIRIRRFIAETTGRDEDEIVQGKRKPQDVWDAAVSLVHDHGVSVITVADALGTSRQTVYNRCG